MGSNHTVRLLGPERKTLKSRWLTAIMLFSMVRDTSASENSVDDHNDLDHLRFWMA